MAQRHIENGISSLKYTKVKRFTILSARPQRANKGHSYKQRKFGNDC